MQSDKSSPCPECGDDAAWQEGACRAYQARSTFKVKVTLAAIKGE
jgi:predicted RNA-binding Zn-ribbon protein involved in translation (DUF1610 family)